MISRTFGQPITEFSSLASAISQFAEKLAEKLRHQHQLAKNLTVFIVWKNRDSSTSATLTLDQPSQLATQLVETAIKTLKQCIFSSPKPAIKAGVIISNLVPELTFQSSLFVDELKLTTLNSHHQAQLAMDKLNLKFGPQTVQIARSIRPDQTADWHSRQNFKSPDYVTDWHNLIKVY
jgi:DNA polymerase V